MSPNRSAVRFLRVTLPASDTLVACMLNRLELWVDGRECSWGFAVRVNEALAFLLLLVSSVQKKLSGSMALVQVG